MRLLILLAGAVAVTIGVGPWLREEVTAPDYVVVGPMLREAVQNGRFKLLCVKAGRFEAANTYVVWAPVADRDSLHEGDRCPAGPEDKIEGE